MESINQLYQQLLNKKRDSLEREGRKKYEQLKADLASKGVIRSGIHIQQAVEIKADNIRQFIEYAISQYKRLSNSPESNIDELEKTFQRNIDGLCLTTVQEMEDNFRGMMVPRPHNFESKFETIKSEALQELEIAKAERQFGVEKAAIPPLTTVRDSLTKLLTRGDFDAELPQTLADAERANRPLSLIIVDIDHFKNVNDTYGHQKGDEVLAGVAACIASVVENKGRVYRYGGEEIVVVLNNHNIQEATTVAERARRQLESERIADISVTASFGVSTFPDHGRSSADIIRAADTALYDAKNRGRNLVRISGEPEPPKDQVREPERKLPSHGVLTEKEKSMLREQYFRGVTIRCPRDRAILKVNEFTEIGKATASLHIWCKMCGLTEKF